MLESRDALCPQGGASDPAINSACNPQSLMLNALSRQVLVPYGALSSASHLKWRKGHRRYS